MSAILVGNTWLYQTLSADPTLAGLVPGGINAGLLPEGTPLPAISIGNLSTKDTNAIAVRVLTQCVYQVKAIINSASILLVGQIQKQVDSLLQGALNRTLPDGSGIVLGCIREYEVEMDDPDLGVEFRQLIAVYRLYIQELP